MVYALIPARSGSKGIPDKNFRPLKGRSPVNRAIDVCHDAGIDPERCIISTDIARPSAIASLNQGPYLEFEYLNRPSHLATDDTPMIDVVKHALDAVPGELDDIWVLLQPTQPLRAAAHVTAAIRMLEGDETYDSVVSVAQLHATHAPEFALRVAFGALYPTHPLQFSLNDLPWSRHDVEPAYIRDGTVYAFRRRTVMEYGHIYGRRAAALLIPASETCQLDTDADWLEADRRLRG